MAFDPNQQDPNKQPDQQGQPAQPVLPTTSSAPGSGPGSSAGKAGTATPQSAPAQPFQNLQAYLGANQPQIEAQGSKIASDLGNQYGQVQSDINKGKTDFNTQVAGGYAAPNQDIVNQATSNPTDFVSNPDNVKAFQSLYNDQYTGPTAFENTGTYGNLSGEVSKASQAANLLNSPEGVQTYFQGQNPNATKGGNVLDSVLLQGSPDVYTNIQAAAKPFAGLSDYLGNATTEANQGVTNAQQTAQQTSQGLQNQFTGAGGIIPTFQNDLTGRITTAQTAEKQTADQVLPFLKNLSGTTPQGLDLAKELGLTPQELAGLKSNQDVMGSYSKLINPQGGQPYAPAFDLTNYASQLNPANAITPASFASPQEYAKADALSKLTGQDLSSFLNPANASQAGTAPKSLLNFNKTGAQTDSSNAVKQTDTSVVSQVAGVDPTVPGALNALAPFWNAVLKGQTNYSSNPDANARGMAAIQAAIRQGWFKPAP